MATAKEMQDFEDDKRSLSFLNPEDLLLTVAENFDLRSEDESLIRATVYNDYGISYLNVMLNDQAGKMLWLQRNDMDMHSGTRLTYQASQHAQPIVPAVVPEAEPVYADVVRRMQALIGEQYKNLEGQDLSRTAEAVWSVMAQVARHRGEHDLIYRAYWHVARPVAPPIQNNKLQVGDRIRRNGSPGLEGVGIVSKVWSEPGIYRPRWHVEYLLDTPVQNADGSERMGAVTMADSVAHERDWPMTLACMNTPNLDCVASKEAPPAKSRPRALAPAP